MIDRTDSNGWTYNGLCPKCGKPYIYVGDVPLGGFTKGLEPYCTCNENRYNITRDSSNIFVSGNQGWVCPKCGKVFSPSIFECWYCNSASVSSIVSTTDTVIRDENDDTPFTFTDDNQTDNEEDK